MSLGEFPAEVDNFERRNSSAGIPFVPPAILGTMGLVFGSLDRAFIVADAVFPALALGLLYAATKGVIRTTIFRLALAWCTLIIPFGPRNFLWSGYDAFLAAPDFARTPQPEISFVFVLIALLLLSRALQTSAGWGTVTAAGGASALIVYSYYFYSVAWGITLEMLVILAALWRLWILATRAIKVFCVMIVASLPYVVATARGRAEGGQTFLLSRMGAYTHLPRMGPLLLLLAGFALAWKFGKRLFTASEQNARIGMFMVLLLSGLAGLNLQVISGYDAQHSHFWSRLIFPTAFFLCGCWLFSVVENLRGYPQLTLSRCALIALICIIGNSGARQIVVGLREAQQQRETRPEIELMTWVRSNLPGGIVVGTVDPDLILMIPALTLCFTYVPAGIRSLTPTHEILSRYYYLASILGLSVWQVESMAASPGHVQPSQLLLALGYSGTPQTFSEGYLRYEPGAVDLQNRLDYIISTPAPKIPANIAERFVHARILHTNDQYQIIGLR